MSVQQESISHGALAGADEEAPELEYVAVRQDSLTMFFSAIGGAVLGALLTLLILAAINGGSLRYVGGASRIAQLELAFNQLSANVDTVANNVVTLDSNIQESVKSLDDKIGEQDSALDDVNIAVDDLNLSRGQFNTLISALTGALNTINSGEASPAATDSTAGDATNDTSGDGATSAEPSAEEVSGGTINVIFFADANGNQVLDAGEENLLGISAALVGSDGETVASLESTDGGMRFQDIPEGEYTLVVEESGDYILTDNVLGSVSVSEVSEEQVVYVAVDTE